MAIVALQTLPEGVRREQTEAVSAEIMAGGPVAGCLSHSLIEDGGRIKSVDIWESQQALAAFVETRLRPAIALVAERNGQDPSQLPTPEPPQIFEAFDVFTAS
jgi:quinol monooxygenase YgiN